MEQPTETPARKHVDKPEEKEGSAEGLNHMATLAGLGLLGHLAEWSELTSEQVISERPADEALAVDPRDAVDPRKKFVPR